MPDDLDDFLRRAAQQRKKRRPAEIVILEPKDQQADRGAQQQRGQQQQRPAPPKPLPEIVEPEPSLTSGSVAEHVAAHLDSRKFAERASNLGAEVDLADDIMEAHLQQVFDHPVGKLTDEAMEVTRTEFSPLTSIIHDLLSNRDDLRRAIILNELLTPRFHDWR